MHSSLTGITGLAVGYALDGLSMRHSAIATNIANANSPGYRPMRVSFENQLAGMLAEIKNESSTTSSPNPPPPLVSFEPQVTELLRRNTVENEMVQLNRNVLQYEALIKGLNKYSSTIATAINEGRR